MKLPAMARAKGEAFRAAWLISLMLGCETDRRESEHSIDLAPSVRPTAGAVVLAGRPKLARLPPRVAALVEPSLLLYPEKSAEAEPPIGQSRIGGLPDLPQDVVWPSPRGRPLAFVAQFDLAEVLRQLPNSELPSAGMLYFFYDAKEQPWGYSPLDRDGFRVVYRTESATRLRRRKAPPGLEPPPFGVQRLNMQSERSYPDSVSYVIGRLELGVREREEYDGFLQSLLAARPSPHHRLLGYAEAIGGDPQTECHLVTNGVDLSDGIETSDPRWQSLSKGSVGWRLLLQLDSNAADETTWGDWERLYFFIRRSDLEARHFESAWMVAQSD